MSRTGLLRTGYALLGVAFLALGATFTPVGAGLLVVGLVAGFAGGLLLAFSGEDLPRMAGWIIVGYFLLTFVAFLLQTPWSFRGGFYVNKAPLPLWTDVFEYLVLGLPLLFGATAVVAVWDLDVPPRAFLAGAVAGFVLVGILTVLLAPRTADETEVLRAAQRAAWLSGLFAASALSGATGAFWASARPA